MSINTSPDAFDLFLLYHQACYWNNDVSEDWARKENTAQVWLPVLLLRQGHDILGRPFPLRWRRIKLSLETLMRNLPDSVFWAADPCCTSSSGRFWGKVCPPTGEHLELFSSLPPASLSSVMSGTLGNRTWQSSGPKSPRRAWAQNFQQKVDGSSFYILWWSQMRILKNN